MKVQRFEDLICWQKTRVLTNSVYELTRLPGFSKDFELVRQIRGAAVSAMSNIAEGFERWTRKELIRFLDIAKGSAGEVRSQSGVALTGVQVDVLAVKVQTPNGTGSRRGGDAQLGTKPSGTVVLDSHLLGSALSTSDGRFEVLLAPGQVATQ